MPLPFAALKNDVLLAMPSATYDTSSSPRVFSTNDITYLAFDVTVTSFTGGTAPNIQFVLERQGIADQLWYGVLTTTITSAGFNTWDLGPGFGSGSPPNNMQHAVLSTTARLRWTFGGTSAPTAVTFSASIIGR